MKARPALICTYFEGWQCEKAERKATKLTLGRQMSLGRSLKPKEKLERIPCAPRNLASQLNLAGSVIEIRVLWV
jgi:hypothetical protein